MHIKKYLNKNTILFQVDRVGLFATHRFVVCFVLCTFLFLFSLHSVAVDREVFNRISHHHIMLPIFPTISVVTMQSRQSPFDWQQKKNTAKKRIQGTNINETVERNQKFRSKIKSTILYSN